MPEHSTEEQNSYQPYHHRVFSHWSRGFLIVLIGTFSAIALIAGGIFFSGLIPLSKIDQKFNYQPMPTPVNETANWKTYTDTTYGISFMYPSKWKFSDSWPLSHSNTNNKTLNASVVETDLKTERFINGFSIGNTDDFTYLPTEKPSHNLAIDSSNVLKTTLEYTPHLDTHKTEITKITTTKVNNIDAISYTVIKRYEDDESYNDITETNIYFYYSNQLFSVVYFGPDTSSLNKILNSIKLTHLQTPHLSITITPTQTSTAHTTAQTKKVEPTDIPTPTNTPAPPTNTPIPQQGKPVLNISFPTEGQSISYNTSQTFCVVDVPVENTRGVQRKENTGSGWNSYHAIGTLCYDPAEGANTLQLQYKNDSNQESDVYTVHFTFHHE